MKQSYFTFKNYLQSENKRADKQLEVNIFHISVECFLLTLEVN